MENKAFLPVFVGFGEWILSIFNVQLSTDGIAEETVSAPLNQPETPTTPTPENPSS